MKVTFIQPPIQDFYSTPVRRQPLGLLYLAGIAHAAAWDTALINGHSPKSKIMLLPPEMEYLKPYFQGEKPLFPFRHYYHFGLSFQEIKRQIKENPSDLFAVSSLFTPYYQEAERVMRLVKEIYPGVPVAAGGGHATLYPDRLLDLGLADFVIAGEGETGFAALLSYLKTGDTEFLKKPSLLLKDRDFEIIHEISPVLNLDTLPFPRRELLKDRDFKFYQKRGVSLLFSRGCPNACSFCVSSKIFGKTYRCRAGISVLQEMRFCFEKWGVTVFNFEDDNFFRNPAQTEALLKEIIRFKKNPGIDFDLTAMNGMSVEHMTAESVELLKRAGFNELNLSLAVFKAEDQKKLSRPFNTAKFEEIALKALKEKMNVRAYFILGLPGQTRRGVLETLYYLKSLKVKPIPSVYYRVTDCPEEFWKIQRSSAFANPGSLSREEQMELFALCLLQ